MTAVVHPAPMSAASAPAPHVPALTWVTVFTRMLAIQGSWNYETLIGNGVGFCLEPVLRLLPGGVQGGAFKAAMARESAYFNAHPYLAAVAVGALARAELTEVPPERIERFRTALAGPLGSVGDRLVWAGWLPFCSLLALVAFGAGARPAVILAIFLLLYNAGHLALRVWGLHVGWARGLGVASALGNPVLRAGPAHVAGRRRGGGRRRPATGGGPTAGQHPLGADRRRARGRRRGGDRARASARARGRLEARPRAARSFRSPLRGPLMVERTVQIMNKNGLHARPAAEIVKISARFQSEIILVKDGMEVNGKSIMGVMMLAAECAAAVDALATLIANKFGER
jgi:phosphotransferase system HPr (HPr) family protein